MDAGRTDRPQSRAVRRSAEQGAADGIRRMSTIPELPEAPDGPLLVDQLRFMAARYPNETGYADLNAGASLTFAQWNAQSNQVARWLVEQGVGKQDRVALYMESDHCLQWIVAYAAIHKAGAVMVPVNTRLSLDEVKAILGHAEPSAIITNDALSSNVRAIEDMVSINSTLSADHYDA